MSITNHRSIDLPNNDPYLIPQIEKLLATASKYEVSDVCRKIIRHIESQWPNDLARWDLLAGYVAAGLETTSCMPIDHIPEPAAAIALGRKYDIFDILPAAFYDLSTIPSLNEWDIRFEYEEHRADPPVDYKGRAARWKLLSGIDLLAIYQGRELLTAHAEEVSERDFFYKACTTTSKQTCQETKKLLRRKISSEGARDILRCLQTLLASTSNTLCESCHFNLECHIETERKEIWRRLPEIFNLPKGAHAAEVEGRSIKADYLSTACSTYAE